MNLQKSLILLVAFFGMAIGAYYLISPYERCVRNQSARLGTNEIAGMGGVTQKDIIEAMCAKTTNW